jgi:hypothetical protein
VLGVVEQAAIDLGRRLLQERRGCRGGAQLLGRIGCLVVPLAAPGATKIQGTSDIRPASARM